MRRLLFLSLALVACDVEPKTYPTTPADTGPRPDASADSGVLDCSNGGSACKATEYCDQAGSCVIRPTSCRSLGDCRGGDGCVIATSSVGRCAPTIWRCELDVECRSDERCTDLGYCARKAERFEIVDEAPKLIPTCAAPQDCGPGGRCVAGECAACATNADCGDLTCRDGACVEATPCTTPSSCFTGNTCSAGVCRRPTTGCVSDPSDDLQTGATMLQPARHPGRSICGDDVDWYRITQAVNEGLTVILTSTASTFTPEVSLEAEGFGIVDATVLSLPGLIAIRVPVTELLAGQNERTLYLRVGSADRNGAYALEMIKEPGLCAGDALALYGDDLPARALLGPTNRALLRRHCFGQVDLLAVEVRAEDQLRVAIPSQTELRMTLLDQAGTPLPTSISSTMSRSIITSGRFTADETVYVQTTAAVGPSAGALYLLELGRSLGVRQAACRSVVDLSLTGGSTAISGSLASAVDLGRPSCSPVEGCSGGEATCRTYAAAEAGDTVYRLTPPSAPAILRATVRPIDPGAKIALAILEDCAEDEVLDCNRAPIPGRATTVETLLEDTTPIALMISSDEVAGGFELEIDVEPIAAPANDTCASATALSATATLSVPTYGARDDDRIGTSSNICGPPGAGAGKDRFYTLDVLANERAAVELTGPLGGFLWAGRSCLQMTRTCTSAEALGFGTPVAKAMFEPAQDTTYFIAVDGELAADEGTYVLRTIREPELECLEDRDCTTPLRCDDYRCASVPSNDNCPGTRVDLVSSVVRIQGSTGAANHQLSLTCAGGGSAPEVVYRVPVPLGLTEVVFRIVEARFDPALGVRFAECSNSFEEACNDDVRLPDVLLPEVRISQPAEGDYFVIVDAFAGEGTFTLEIEAIP